MSLFKKPRIERLGNHVNGKRKLVVITCQEVWRELTNYIEDDVSVEVRESIAQHLSGCARCRAVYDGSKNVIQLLANGRVFALPPGFSRRLYDRLQGEF